MLFDTHMHLNADQFEGEIEETIARAEEAGVKKMLVVGFDEKTIRIAMELIDTYAGIYAAIGWHPVDAVDLTDERLAWIEELSQHPKVVAIGETGLDYYWDKSSKEEQKEAFRKQIALAKKVQLPLIIHDRDAHQDIVDLLKEEHAEEAGGIMHCFGGSIEIARECLKMNFYISFGGPVTFKNAKRPKEVAKEVPLDRLLIETDAPFLAPHPYRGKRNEPAYVRLVAEEIALLREMTLEEVAKQTTENAKRVFQLNN
ncbi:TatD family hydrolase [Salisediminibacterium halotolerans]|uniref:TatD family hydrolase n=1 Tax=Salisediminibacterium halotolerans TaxID=517425 RepID=UPI000EAE1D5B|nr:TatD family hydrolase [Salisediminibacterium halotolerans]RLJ80962.1 TatD DNase family protein [Actinophytocola xinjiangensis]RPE83633.1 TatD DNase family protein [Salisediminibacterium halotolerans]TWG37887.1 TatD DNase family protein [Salisediminibacterium halotolerans]GEL07019.1 putative metal-dependent hydrolase YabD [Salisediminibacterium halotolerans]